MPLDKDFKRLVRGRMQKTGESYTAARAVLRKKPALKSRAPSLAEPDYARLAGMSDVAVAAKTGRTWAGWVEALDGAGAQQWPHRRIAECVHQQFKIGDWWGQTVAVGYERIKGLREIGQRRSGAYEASRSSPFARRHPTSRCGSPGTTTPRSRSGLAVSHRKLTSREESARRKAYWGERLEALAGFLSPR